MSSPLQLLSLCRDRADQTGRRGSRTFTCEQLDTVAPLSDADILLLRENHPGDRIKRIIRARIEMAQTIKYQVGHAK